jgi:uncharacterized damage-inducible protein DinB
MTRVETLLAEFQHEVRTARRHLERLPDHRFEWRPHPKSSSAGGLASHLVDCVRFAAPIFSAEELRIDLSGYAPFRATAGAELIEAFDAEVADAVHALAHASDTDASGPWRMLIDGAVRFVKPREAAFRDMALSHLIHHRGQLSVYLRLLDIPVPGSYGPTADER